MLRLTRLIVACLLRPNLQKQTSCSCFYLDIAGRRRTDDSRRVIRLSDDDESYEHDLYSQSHPPLRTTARLRLTGLWKMIVGKKRRIFDSSASATRAAYDLDTYAQNFDEGSAWVEPENLARSFSARFAIPLDVLRRIERDDELFNRKLSGAC
ncbi:hypothetical protein KSP40_PGU020690 [Platanthera guangdongensis]|uniref:Uncharacterized protein n=1 Tax=Platanthera guangdongensis TaxID=2320717 RepID=A0ABR2LGQ1_9ASPA